MNDQQTRKYTVQFDPSMNVLDAVASGNPGQAGYGVRLWIDKNELPSLILPPNQTSFVVEAQLGQHVTALVAARDQAGNYGIGSPIEFQAMETAPPQRPTNLRITDVSLGAVAEKDIAPAARTDETKGYKAVELQVNDEAQVFNVTINNHRLLKDGAVGTIIGLDPINRRIVHAMFLGSAFRGIPPAGGEVTFNADEPSGQISVLTPEQDTITLDEYITRIEKILNENSDAAMASTT